MEGCELIEWGMGYNLRGMREWGELCCQIIQIPKIKSSRIGIFLLNTGDSKKKLNLFVWSGLYQIRYGSVLLPVLGKIC